MVKFKPVIKWSGSKRSQCEEILEHFPKSINTYYEPFCGGCSMLMGLINSDISVKNIKNTGIVLDTNNFTSVYDANFTSKEDIQFVANELQKTRLNVNIPQIKFYTNKIMDKLARKKYTSDKYLYASTILNEMNNSLITLANVLSQGERFVSSIAIHANS